MTRFALLLAAAALAAPGWAGAVSAQSPAAPVYEIDRAHSQVLFKVKHLGISTVTGHFRDFSGTFAFDPANLAAGRATTTIRAASIDTNNDRRDNHLRSADFFEVEKYPEITFTGSRLRREGDGFLLEGTLSMHGVTRPVVLELEHVGSVRGQDGRERVAFNATTRLNRKDFGLTWNRALESGGVLVGDDVQVVLEIAAVRRN